MQTRVEVALDRLNGKLPLAGRQRTLRPEWISLHRAILQSLYDRGRAPAREDPAWLLAGTNLREALAELAARDLVVLSLDGLEVLGAYPMTTEPTPHRLAIGDRAVNAMCALDALSVAPMFGGELEIRSECRVTGEPVTIRQREEAILDASPSTVLVGIRCQRTCGGPAAHSLCRQMVFLKDEAAAEGWRASDGAGGELSSVFPLPDAVALGAAFFKPLVS